MFPDRQVSPIVWPIGILDPDRQVGYFSSITNGIDAIDLNDGRRLWATNDAFIPLLLSDNWLIAQIIIPDRANSIQIAKLDLERMGQMRWLSEQIIFPEWVIVERSPCYRENCRFKVCKDRTHLHLDWQAQNYYKGGTLNLVEMDDLQQAEGRVRLDLDRGEIEMLPSVAQTVTASNDPDLDRKLASGWWIAGENLVSLTTEYLRSDRVRKLELITCSIDPDRRSERVIELVRDKELIYFTTVDGRYVLVSTDPYPNQRSWSIFDLTTSKLLHAIDFPLHSYDGLAAISIFNDKIYLLCRQHTATPAIQNILVVKDFYTGASVWEHQLVVEPIYPLPC